LLACRPDLRRRARHYVRSRADVEDLVQDTMERALRKFTSFRGGGNLGAWLRTIMRRLFLDNHRRRRPEVPGDPADLERVAAPESAPSPPVSIADVQQAFERLEPIYREVSRLYWFERRPYADISRHLGVPMSTVGSRLLRTRRQLSRMLVEADVAA
jgi:RNA polymerase sigma-70 factor (ECF subfamily)